MKKAILIIAAIVAPLLAGAQASAVNKLFDKYNGKEGYTTVVVTHAMFDLFETLSTDASDADFKDITSKLNSIKILSRDDDSKPTAGADFYKEMVRAFPQADYQELMTINDGGEEVKFLIHKNGDAIVELVMVAGGSDPCLIALDGAINLKQVSKLSKSMNLKGFEHLSEVPAKASK